MAPSSLGLVSLYAYFIRRRLNASGVFQQSINIDDETTIHFWAPKLEDHQTRNDKPSLLLIHGFGPVSMWQWRHQVEFFSEYFNLYMPDLIFFGESTTKSEKRTEIFQAECVAKMMEKIGVEKYSVMGTSYGGFVTYHIARMYPERVEKVVIASSGLNRKHSDVDDIVKRTHNNIDQIDNLMLPQNASQLRALLGMVMFKKVDGIPDFMLSHFVTQLYGENRKEKTELLHNITLGKNDVVNISKLPQGVLLVWGVHDQIFPLEMAQKLQRMIGDNVKLETIRKASHIPQTEHPIKFNKVVKSFLCGGSSS